MQIDRQSGLQYPHPKPWLWLILVVLVAGASIYRYTGSRGQPVASDGVAKQTVAADVKSPGVRAQPAATSGVTVATATPSRAETQRAAPSPRATENVSPSNTVGATNAVMALTVIVPRLAAEAMALEEKGDLAGARGKWLDVLRRTTDGRVGAAAEERIGTINIELTLTPRQMPEKVEYVVQAGDAIKRIAGKFGTTIDLVQESNQLQTPDLIRQGDRLLVMTGKFSIVVCKTRNDLVLRLNDEFFKRYRVGTGKYSTTPTGTFAIDIKQKEPPWSRPDGKQIPYGDKENILGTRWMSLLATGATADIKGRGIHGTWDETTLGKAESAGCVRMKNSDVEELYKLVPINTPVTITE